MNKYLVLPFLIALTACDFRPSAPAVPVTPVEPASSAPAVHNQSLQRAIEAEGFSSKGTIETVTEVPVYARISEQIVEFDLELGQRLKKGQVVARLNQAVLKDRIERNKAELEKAEFQYQAILMGQGYKRGGVESAPEEIKRQARINSGYNIALASLQQLEHELTYCTITAPITGAVSRLETTLYSAATPGVPLFYMVDTEHLKVCFDVLENELQKFREGDKIQVISVAYPSEVHEAVVSAISPVVEKNGMVHLEAALKPHPHLMPGMTAIVTQMR